MPASRRAIIGLVAPALLTLATGALAESPLSVDLAFLRTWDSNLSRTPDPISDQINQFSAGLHAAGMLSKQSWFGRWTVDKIEHERHSWRDATLHQADLGWRGELGRSIRAEAEWQQENYLVDLSDFPGRDRVRLRQTHAGIDYLITPAVAVGLAADDKREAHSNPLRQILDYQEQSISALFHYHSGRGSLLRLRATSGDREYQPSGLPGALDFDFSYREAELSIDWAMTEKTRLAASAGRFWREGEMHESGNFGSIEAEWQATEKTSLQVGFLSKRSPPEASQAQPAREQQIKLAALWQLSSKLHLKSEAARWERRYSATGLEPAWQDTTYILSPLTLLYRAHRAIELQARADWQRQNSPQSEHSYDAAQVTIGAKLVF